MHRKKREKLSNRTFAQRHYAAFEELSLMIISDLYKERPQLISRLTAKTNDGGYDGVLCFPIVSDSNNDIYKVLMEAKLRSSSKHDLPLSDFAKTIIIAINTASDKVYISTNAYFSSGTVRKLKQYSKRTGLAVQTLDIGFIVNWIKKHQEDTDGFEDQELIHELLKMERSADCEQQELCPSETLRDGSEEKLIGIERRQLCREATEELHINNGVICICAEVGSGKSFFIRSMIRDIRKSFPNIERFRFSSFTDIRGVFVKLLSFAWCQNTWDVFDMSADDLREVTEYLGDQPFPEHSREMLISLIHQSQTEFDKNLLIHSDILLDFLKTIVPPMIRRTRSLLIISDVKQASRSALDFLCSFVKSMEGKAISFIVELESEDANSEYLWSELKQTRSYLNTINLPQWSAIEANIYLEQLAPELHDKDRKAIVKYFGFLPLTLQVGLETLKQSPIWDRLSFVEHAFGAPSTFRNQLRSGCIDYIIELYAHKSVEMQCSLVLLGLFDGKIELDFLMQTIRHFGLCSPFPEIDRCQFIQKSDSNKQTEYRVIHAAYTERLKEWRYATPSLVYQILLYVASIMDKYYSDNEYIMQKRFDIFCFTNDFTNLKTLWKDLANRYILRNETYIANKVLRTIYGLWMREPATNTLEVYDQYWLLYHLLETTLELYGSGEIELQGYINQIDTILNMVSEENWTTVLSIKQAKATTLHTKCQIMLGNANYQQMLMFANEGLEYIAGDDNPYSIGIKGKLFSDKALALKHLMNLDTAVSFLEDNKNMMRDTKDFMLSYYVHYASLYSASDPQKALDFFNRAKELNNCTLSQELHIEHNIASMHFLLGDLEKATRLIGKVWLKAYENHIPVEEGRSNHLIGCIEWARGNLIEAKKRFTDSIGLFRKHVHRTHLWPSLINISIICREMKLVDDAVIYTSEAVDFLLTYHLENINNLIVSETSIPKILVGMLFLLDNLTQLGCSVELRNKILDMVSCPEFHRIYNEYILSDRLDLYLQNSVYICYGKRMLKV